NPDDRVSVMHKDELLHMNPWASVEPVTSEFHSEADVSTAVRVLIERKAEGVILTSGIGKGARAAITEAGRAKVPVFGYSAEHARAGAVLAREVTMRWGGFEVGRQAGRVLTGQAAGDVPFTQGVDYTTYVNTGAAKSLGVRILGDLMRTARVVTSD